MVRQDKSGGVWKFLCDVSQYEVHVCTSGFQWATRHGKFSLVWPAGVAVLAAALMWWFGDFDGGMKVLKSAGIGLSAGAVMFAAYWILGCMVAPAQEWAAGRGRGDLGGIAAHVRKMLGQLEELGRDEEAQGLDTAGQPKAYIKFCNSVWELAGGCVERAWRLGVFDEHQDLVTILEMVSGGRHGWQGGELRQWHYMQGLWFWLKPNAPDYVKSGDHHPYTLRKLIEMLEAAR